MLANFFNKTRPIATLSLVVLLLFYYLFATFFKQYVELELFSIIKHFSFFTVLVFMLLIIGFIVKKNNLTEDNSYALLISVFVFALFFETMFKTTIVLSNLVLLLAFRKLYSLKSGFNIKKKLFDAGFWIGIAMLIYLWSGVFLVLIYIGLIVFQKATIRNLIVPIIGLITPILLWFTYLVLIDNSTVFFEHFLLVYSFDFSNYQNLNLLIPIAFLTLVLFWSVFSVLPKVSSIGKSFKWSWTVILWNLFFGMIVAALAPEKNGSEMFFNLFPTVVIIANFLQIAKSKVLKNIILYFFLVISVSVYFIA
jgi:hypothetical protein